MENLPDILEGKILERLEENKEIVYFNYFDNRVNFSKLSKENVKKLLTGNSHALVFNNLYVKYGNFAGLET